MNNYVEILYGNLENNAEAVAVVDGERVYSYKEVCGLVGNYASRLTDKGIGKGDKVAIYLPNCIELVVALFAAAKIGAVSVPINSSYKSEEIRHYVGFSEPKLFITRDELSGNVKGVVDKGIVERLDLSLFDWENNNGEESSICGGLKEAAVYLFSTGSTGVPKCISRNHYNMISLADNHTRTIDWNSDDRILFAIPIAHTYGLGNFISAVRKGCSCYLIPSEFNRRKVVGILIEKGITVFPSVPFMLEVLSRTAYKGSKKLNRLRYVISAGSPLSENSFYQFHKAFGIYPRQLYGSSETGVIAMNLHSNPEQKRKSVGKPVSGVEVRIVDENGNEKKGGERGEIVVKSRSMTGGYVNNPPESEKVFQGGYYYTGDIGFIDEEGYLFIEGRKKLFINISGNKVDPYEVEEVIRRHKRVNDVVVIGVSGDDGKEAVMAVIVGSGLTRVDIVKHCKDKISDFKIPTVIDFRTSLPKSPTGKVVRSKILNE